MSKPFRLSRRTWLRGAAAAVALPPLEAMLGNHAQAAPPVRLLTFFFPNGRPAKPDTWTPALEGTGYALTPCLEPLGALKADVNVVSGVNNKSGMAIPGAHEPGAGSFATDMGVEIGGSHGWGKYNALGPSVDQVAAQKLGTSTRFPSLVTSTELKPFAGYCGMISWAGAYQPVPPERDPQALFDKLFAAGMGKPLPGTEYQQSVLDYVKGRIAKLNTRVGTHDRARLDAHFTSIREMETQLKTVSAAKCGSSPMPFTPAADRIQRGRLFMQLLAYAFKCDLTRYGSFQAANAISSVSPLPGMPNHHHGLSHDGPNDWFTKITAHYVGELVYLLSLLKAVPEGTGNLLDNTLIFYSSELSDGAKHSKNDMPIILAGRAGGKIKTGRHIRFDSKQGRSTGELFVTLLNAVGVATSSFGAHGKQPLDGIV